MNLSRTAKNIGWITSHPEYRSHPFSFPLRVLRWEWHRAVGTPACLPLFDFVIYARPSDGVGRLICYFRDRADKLFAFMKSYLRPGMTFVDVGANIGSHTVLGARLVANEGRVFSFEAVPETFSVLEANIKLNEVANAVLFNQCVSDNRGFVTLNINANSARSSLRHPGSSQMSLPASPLDDLLPSGLPIDLLKIDVEGGDYLVLEGARRIFRTSLPKVVVIEVSSSGQEIRDFLVTHGYRLYEFDDSRATLVEAEWPAFDTYAVLDSIRHELSDFSFESPKPKNKPSA